MSRLWPDPVRVALLPDRVLGVRLTHGLRPKPAARQEQAVEPAKGGRTWAGAVDQLLSLLSALGAKRARVTVILSDRFVRYLILPPSPALASEADWRAFAEHRFAEVFGAHAGGSTVLASAEGDSARVACAFDAALVEAMRSTLESRGHRLVSLRPHFVAGFNRVCRAIRGEPAWFVGQEPGQLTVGSVAGRQWRFIRQRRVGQDWLDELPCMLERESELAGLPSAAGKAYVASLDATGRVPAKLGSIAIESFCFFNMKAH